MEPEEAGSVGKILLKLRVGKAAEAVEASPIAERKTPPASPIAETKTPPATPIVETKIRCEFCGKTFDSGKAYGGHKSSAHIQANKDYSNKKLNSNARKQQGSGSSSGDYSCPECGKPFGSEKSLYGHMRCHPERHWRGMERPHSKIETPETNSDADSVFNLMNWSTRSKRGRAPIKPNFCSNSQEEVVAGRQLLIKHAGEGSSRSQSNNKRKSSESDSQSDSDVGEGKARVGLYDFNFDTGSTSQLEKKPKSSDLDVGKIRARAESEGLETGSTLSSPIGIDLTDERVQGALEVLAKGMEKKMSLEEEKVEYKCNTCSKSFRTHQALGGHKSSHNKFKLVIVNTDDLESSNVKTAGRRRSKINAAAAAASVKFPDLNKMPEEEDKDGDDANVSS